MKFGAVSAAVVAHVALFASMGIMWDYLHHEAPAPAPAPAPVNETWTCTVCQHVYDPAKDGDGMAFEDLPDTWTCPVCGKPKSVYEKSAAGEWVHDHGDDHSLSGASPHKLAYGDFKLHPLLMSIAFIVWGPLGGMTYSVYEGMLGLSHARAKALHATIQLTGVCFAVVGVLSMRKTHESNPPHFQTLHSWIGIFVMFAYAIQWLVSFPVFYFLGGAQRAKLLPFHVIFGLLVTFSSLLTVITGILKVAGTSPADDDGAQQWKHLNASGVCVFVAMFAMGYVIYERHRSRVAAKAEDEHSNLESSSLHAYHNNYEQGQDTSLLGR